jgi:hypothetical protein
MDFKKTIGFMAAFFEKEKIDFALIGAFALQTYGYVRATQDIDFILRKKDQARTTAYLESLGYETLYRSSGYSNHVHSLRELGRIDFVYTDDRSADILFRQCVKSSHWEGVMLPVISPEHLIALKVFAMKNDSTRIFREMSDIQEILRVTGLKAEVIRHYFEKFGQIKWYDELIGHRQNDDAFQP